MWVSSWLTPVSESASTLDVSGSATGVTSTGAFPDSALFWASFFALRRRLLRRAGPESVVFVSGGLVLLSAGGGGREDDAEDRLPVRAAKSRELFRRPDIRGRR